MLEIKDELAHYSSYLKKDAICYDLIYFDKKDFGFIAIERKEILEVMQFDDQF